MFTPAQPLDRPYPVVPRHDDLVSSLCKRRLRFSSRAQPHAGRFYGLPAKNRLPVERAVRPLHCILPLAPLRKLPRRRETIAQAAREIVTHETQFSRDDWSRFFLRECAKPRPGEG